MTSCTSATTSPGGGGATPTQPFEVPIVGCENLDCSGVAEHTIEGCVEGLVEGRFAMTHLEIELETSMEQPLRWSWIAGTTQQVQPSVLSRYEFIMAADGWPQLGVAPIASNAEGDNVLLQFGVFEPSPNPDFREYRYWTGSAGAPDDLRDGWIAFFEVPAVEGDPVFGAYDYTVDVRHHPGGPNPPAAQGTIHVQACFRGTTY